VGVVLRVLHADEARPAEVALPPLEVVKAPELRVPLGTEVRRDLQRELLGQSHARRGEDPCRLQEADQVRQVQVVGSVVLVGIEADHDIEEAMGVG
jgi:hypothetical protein